MAVLDRPQVEYRTPLDLVDEVRSGVLRIPTFQRGFKWDSRDVLALFDSVVKGYPIGNLLLWRRPAPAQSLRIGTVDVDAPAVDSALWVVDGQQRITALVSGLVAAESTVDDRFRVHLDVESGAFHTPGPRQEVPASWLPVNVLADTPRLLRWMRENEAWLTEERMAFVEQTAKAIREYRIPAYVVTNADETDLMEIFARINTTGKPLTRSDVFQALHAGTTQSPRVDLRDLASLPAQLGFGSVSEDLALEWVEALTDGRIGIDGRSEFASDRERQAALQGVVAAIRSSIEFLQSAAGVPNMRLLFDPNLIPQLARYVKQFGAPEGRAATLMRRWVWRAAAASYRTTITWSIDMAKARAVGDGLVVARRLAQGIPQRSEFKADLAMSTPVTYINLLALLAARPREVADGRPVGVADLMALKDPWRTVVSGEDRALRTFANLVTIVAPGLSGEELREALAHTTQEIAASHLIDEVSQGYLREGRDEEFLARRGEAVTRAIETHVRRMAEWGARDGKAMSDILRAA